MKRKFMAITAAALALSMLSSTAAFAAEWGKTGGKWFYYLDDGSVAKNTWIRTEATETAGATAYWVNSDGTMAATQWVNDGNAWYYVDGGGTILTNQMLIQNNGSDSYWLLEDGKMAVSSWIQDPEGKWYYFQDNGKALKNGWKTVDGEEFYFLKSGALAVDALVPGGGRVDAQGRRMK
ncbi:MAG: hypothetical protein PHV18_13005 [Lachnospiraceae bacterium]|nr:hypothetical protein [Lachnospiraceae bacterium]